MDSYPQNTIAAPSKVVPLLAQIQRVEELTSALAFRLDPITNHTPSEKTASDPATVTGRITALGDSLQYLLDHIEL